MQWLSNTGLRVGNGDGDVCLVERAFIKRSSGLLNYYASVRLDLDTYYSLYPQMFIIFNFLINFDHFLLKI
jgi:hypothetical protein